MGQEVVVWPIAMLKYESRSLEVFASVELPIGKELGCGFPAGGVCFVDHSPVDLLHAWLTIFLVPLEDSLHFRAGNIAVIQKISPCAVPIRVDDRRSLFFGHRPWFGTRHKFQGSTAWSGNAQLEIILISLVRRILSCEEEAVLSDRAADDGIVNHGTFDIREAPTVT